MAWAVIFFSPPRRRLAREAAALLGFAAVLAALLRVGRPADLTWSGLQPGRDELTLAQVAALAAARPVLWVDARDAAAFHAGHLPDAVSLNEAEWEIGFAALMQRWTPAHLVVVYCDSSACRASHSVAARLRERGGLPEVYVLFGGWEAAQKTSPHVPRATP